MDTNTNGQPATQNPTQSVPQNSAPTTETSQSTKTLVTVLLLVFTGPIGLIVMWVWSGWKVWVKLLITIVPLILTAMLIVPAIVLMAINPAERIEQAEKLQKIQDEYNSSNFTMTDEYYKVFDESFMEACVDGGGTEDMCQCVLDGIRTNMTEEEFSEMISQGASIASSEEYVNMVQDITMECLRDAE